MNLNNFEKHVEAKIADRGLDYFENDQVVEIEQVDVKEFSATVQGSEDYTIFLKLDEKLEIVEHACDCPYDLGDVCKHEVAVMYFLRDTKMYDDPIEEDSDFLKIKKDLAAMKKEDLMDIVLNWSKRNKVIKEDLMWELGYED